MSNKTTRTATDPIERVLQNLTLDSPLKEFLQYNYDNPNAWKLDMPKTDRDRYKYSYSPERKAQIAYEELIRDHQANRLMQYQKLQDITHRMELPLNDPEVSVSGESPTHSLDRRSLENMFFPSRGKQPADLRYYNDPRNPEISNLAKFSNMIGYMQEMEMPQSMIDQIVYGSYGEPRYGEKTLAEAVGAIEGLYYPSRLVTGAMFPSTRAPRVEHNLSRARTLGGAFNALVGGLDLASTVGKAARGRATKAAAEKGAEVAAEKGVKKTVGKAARRRATKAAAEKGAEVAAEKGVKKTLKETAKNVSKKAVDVGTKKGWDIAKQLGETRAQNLGILLKMFLPSKPVATVLGARDAIKHRSGWDDITGSGYAPRMDPRSQDNIDAVRTAVKKNLEMTAEDKSQVQKEEELRRMFETNPNAFLRRYGIEPITLINQ